MSEDHKVDLGQLIPSEITGLASMLAGAVDAGEARDVLRRFSHDALARKDARNHPHDEPCPKCDRRQWTDEDNQEVCQACGYDWQDGPDDRADKLAERYARKVDSDPQSLDLTLYETTRDAFADGFRTCQALSGTGDTEYAAKMQRDLENGTWPDFG